MNAACTLADPKPDGHQESFNSVRAPYLPSCRAESGCGGALGPPQPACLLACRWSGEEHLATPVPTAVSTCSVLVQVQRKLIIALVLALLFMVVEVVGGIMANRCAS